MFTKTLNAVKSRISFTGLIPVLVVSILFVTAPKALAQGTTAVDSLMTTVSSLMGMVIVALNVLMWILFWMLLLVTDNNFIFEPKMVEMLYGIWLFSRDIVNVCFAFLLLIGAVLWTIYPIVYAEQIKGLIPKFVAAVILVNFSWFIPRVIFDTANILTYSIYQIPSLATTAPCRVYSFSNGTSTVAPTTEPCKYVSNIAFLDQTDNIRTGMTAAGGTWECSAKPLVCILLTTNSSFTLGNHQSIIFNGLIVNYARLRGLNSLPNATVKPAPSGPGGGFSGADIQNLIKQFVKYIVVMVIHIALFFPIAAMVGAFFIRIPVLWLTMAFMPFVALGYVIGDKMGDMNPVDKIGKQFISAAFLPAYVGVPFAVGYMLLNAAMTVTAPTTGPAASFLPVFLGISSFWQIFWLFIALGVLWVGVFAALKKNEITGKFTQGIQDSGKALGEYAIKAPLSIPFIPMGKPGADGKKPEYSLGGLLGSANPKNLLQQANSSIAQDTNKLLSGGKKDELHEKIDVKIISKIESDGKLDKVAAGTLAGPEGKKAIEDALAAINNVDEIKKLGLSQEKLLEIYMQRRRSDGKVVDEKKFKDVLKG